MTHKPSCLVLFVALFMPFLCGCLGQTDLSQNNHPRSITNSIGMEFVLIDAGEFMMGSNDVLPVGGKNTPSHKVRISKPYYLGKFEVTHQQYRLLTGPYWTVPPMFYSEKQDAQLQTNADSSRFPADNVNWNAAHAYCEKLSDLPEEKAAGRVYRLPTEAEWEYACRAGTTTNYSFGNEILLSQANFNASSDSGEGFHSLGRTAEVGSYPANAFGLHDMHGNVWEWCFGGMDEYSKATRTDPPGELAIYNVLRGGAWDYPKTACRSDFRTAGVGGYVFVGFRIVCELEKVQTSPGE